MKTIEDVPVSTLDLVAAGFMIGLDGSAHQTRALQGLVVEEFMIDLGDNTHQVKAPQARTPRENGVSAAKETTPPQVTPHKTRTKKQDIGSPGENIAMRKMKIYPFFGVAKRSKHSRGASAIIQKIREGACPPMLKGMMGRVILMTT